MTLPNFTTNPFFKAVAMQIKLKMLIMGESGTGKTWTALELAKRLAEKSEGKIAFIDSEGGSSKIYAKYFDFDVMELDGTSPQHYIRAIHAAERFGYAVLIVDSFSGAWSGPDGVLSIVDSSKQKWAKGKPEQHKLVHAIQSSNMHIIGTARTKNSYSKTSEGKIDFDTASIDARQDPEFEYEFDLSAIMDYSHTLTFRKSRCHDIKLGHIASNKSDYDSLVETLNSWLNAGDPPPAWYEDEEQNRRVDDAITKLRDLKGDFVDEAIERMKPRSEYTTRAAYGEDLKATIIQLEEEAEAAAMSALRPVKNSEIDETEEEAEEPTEETEGYPKRDSSKVIKNVFDSQVEKKLQKELKVAVNSGVSPDTEESDESAGDYEVEPIPF